MNIVILGSGNIATVFTRLLHKAGHQIGQIYSRNAAAASELAYEVDTESANYLSLIKKDADAYLLAVPDSAVPELAAELYLPDKVVAHCGATLPLQLLEKVTVHHGVLYPLQSISKNAISLPEIPVFYDGATEKARNVLYELAASISGSVPQTASDDERLKLHIAAVFVNNFVNHMYTLAADFCKQEGVDFKKLLPLIQETTHRIEQQPPAMLQTGPAIRNDSATIKKHLQALSGYPQLVRLYESITQSIQSGSKSA